MIISELKSFFSRLNKKRKKISLLITKRRYALLQNKYNLLIDSLVIQPSPLFVPPRHKWERSHEFNNRELCLFVTFSEHPEIKSYVAAHVRSFVSHNIDVVLIINTNNFDQPLRKIESIPESVAIYSRENKGFDFGAWSQVMGELDINNLDKLYWVNDSIYGPLNNESFNNLIERIRQSKSDFLGLTSSQDPFLHLQSYFLVFNKSILRCKEFFIYIKNIMQLPTKSIVIDSYETRLTQFLKNLGFNYELIYRLEKLNGGNLIYKYPRELVEAGFPYVKTQLVKSGKDNGVAAEFLPQYLPLE